MADFTGSDNELFAILDAAWVDGDALEHLSRADLLAWRDAAVARHLAEAGAVHQAVHTSARIVNYLERHGWKRMESPTKPKGQVFWSLPAPNRLRWIHPGGVELDAPLCDDVPNYADVVDVVVNRIAWAESGRILAPGEVRAAILLEIALLPDEVAW